MLKLLVVPDRISVADTDDHSFFHGPTLIRLSRISSFIILAKQHFGLLSIMIFFSQAIMISFCRYLRQSTSSFFYRAILSFCPNCLLQFHNFFLIQYLSVLQSFYSISFNKIASDPKILRLASKA